MSSVSFATITLRRSWESSLLLPIMKCFLCDTLVMRHLFIGHQLVLNQLILISTDKGQDCFRITDRFLLVSWLSMSFCTSLSSCSILFPCVIPLYYTELNFWNYLFCCLCLYGLLGLLPTSGENFMSTAPLEIYLLRKMVTCSILILPAVRKKLCNIQEQVFNPCPMNFINTTALLLKVKFFIWPSKSSTLYSNSILSICFLFFIKKHFSHYDFYSVFLLLVFFKKKSL